MQGLRRRWIVPAPPMDGPGPEDRRVEEALRDASAWPLVRRVLAARGIGDVASARRFCQPRITDLHDPSLIPDLDRAAERLLGAARAGEPITIFGDYDVDGCTGSAILQRMLAAVAPSAPVSVYIPHRVEEGYGLSVEAVEGLAREGARVIVSVDCGVTAIEPALLARRLGVDLIVTDHHNPPATLGDLPAAYAVVHPRRPDSAYPFGDLSGAGVAFKVAWRLATAATGSERVGPALRDTLLDLLALAALGAIADVVPLVDENRAIARHGLARLRTTSIVGLRALLNASGLGGDRVESDHVGFVLAPRLNACGRLAHARDAVELLTSGDATRCEAIARELTRLNDERRRQERAVFEEASEMARSAGMTGEDRRAIVLAHESWHPGVVGIACSRLVERFGRPAILLQRDGEACKGSGRSVEGFNLHAALAACAGRLESFGGHDMAAGLRVRTEGLGAFTEAFLAEAGARLSAADLVPTLRVDCRATLAEMSPEAVEELRGLGPFGRGNPQPTVLVEGARVVRRPEPLGAQGRHLKITLEQDGVAVRAPAWNWGESIEDIPAGSVVDAALRPRLNEWNGRVSVEPEVCDVRVRAAAEPAVVSGRSRCRS